MRTELNSRWRSALGATVGAGALLFTFACSGTPNTAAALGTPVSAQSLAANQTGVPVLVSCEPHQRALVRPVVVNGAAVSQVECVAMAPTAGYAPNATAAPVPVGYAPAGHPAASAPQPVYR